MTNWNCCNHTAWNTNTNNGCGCGCRNTEAFTIPDGGCVCNDNGTITISTGNNTHHHCGCNNTWAEVNGTAWTSHRCGCGCGC